MRDTFNFNFVSAVTSEKSSLESYYVLAKVMNDEHDKMKASFEDKVKTTASEDRMPRRPDRMPRRPRNIRNQPVGLSKAFLRGFNYSISTGVYSHHNHPRARPPITQAPKP